MTTPVSHLLTELNNFRIAEGKAPFADWRKARHQPMLDAYRETAPAVAPPAHKANAESVDEATGTHDFAEAVKAAKQPTYKALPRFDKSGIDKPVGFVWQFCMEHPELTRKEAVATLVQHYNVNFSTARTQYQKWYTANKAKKGA